MAWIAEEHARLITKVEFLQGQLNVSLGQVIALAVPHYLLGLLNDFSELMMQLREEAVRERLSINVLLVIRIHTKRLQKGGQELWAKVFEVHVVDFSSWLIHFVFLYY